MLNIVRGLPGSGKTTFVMKNMGLDDGHFEADMYFNAPNNTYNFNPAKLLHAHSWCFQSTRITLATGRDVWVSNTFTQKWEMQDYLDLAEESGYEVKVYRMLSQYENVHNVPFDVIKKMTNRFEHYPNEIIVE